MTPNRTSSLLVLAILLVSSAAVRGDVPSHGEVQPKIPPVDPAIQAELKPWHPFERAWDREATVVVKAGYKTHGQMCLFLPGGGNVMLSRTSFVPSAALRGKVACPTFDKHPFGLGGPQFPHNFAEGRTYLVFLKPTEASLAKLNTPDPTGAAIAALTDDEYVAVVDLSETAAEAEAGRTPATKSGTHDGFTFTPVRWDALREADDVAGLDVQEQYLSFIRAVVLKPGASAKDVRSYLGRPTVWTVKSDGFSCAYRLHHGKNEGKGTVVGEVTIEFSADLKMRKFEVGYGRCTRKTEHESSWEAVTPDEVKQLLRNGDRGDGKDGQDRKP